MTPSIRQRMIPPQVATDLGLQPLVKRAVMEGLMWIAEDSGCFNWNPRDVRGAALPLESGVSDDDVEEIMREFVKDGRIWTYHVDELLCGFLPELPSWQRSLTRWNVPERVPLPPGITFEQIESSNRYGSCRYKWPKTKSEMLGATKHSDSQPPTLPAKHSITQGAAPSLPTGSEQSARKYENCLCGGKSGCSVCGGSGVKFAEVPS